MPETPTEPETTGEKIPVHPPSASVVSAMVVWHILVVIGLLLGIARLWPAVLPETKATVETKAAPARPFQEADVKDANGLNKGLNDKTPFAQYLNGQFQQTGAAAKKTPASTTPELTAALVGDLNKELDDARLADKAGASLSAEAKKQAAKKPTGEDLRRLNRLILEEAFPTALVHSAPSDSDRADGGTQTAGDTGAPGGGNAAADDRENRRREMALLGLVIAFGGLGSVIRAAMDFTAYVGIGKMGRSWVGWYLLQPFIGMALALIFYCVARGGLVTMQPGVSTVNVFVIAGLAGLVGVFSKAALRRLQLFFDSSASPEPGGAATMSPMPIIETIEPSPVSITPPGESGTNITVTGKNFAKDASLRVGDTEVKPTVAEPNILKAAVILEHSGTVKVVVVNPAPGGALHSQPKELTVT